MRLSLEEVRSILFTAEQIFGQDCSIWLFGSRVDDSKRGGDIDLLILCRSEIEVKMMMRKDR